MKKIPEPSANELARLVFRFGLGINMLMHGLVRVPKLEQFVSKSGAAFADTLLPVLLVNAFLYTLPFLELACGLLILLGGQLSKWGYALGGFIMTLLLFGTTLREDWARAGSQVVYVVAFALALRGLESSRRSRA